MITGTGVIRLDDWKDTAGILDNIRYINECYYGKILENLIYIEKQDKSIFTAYSIELRDAYAHLVKIFAYDNNPSEENRIKINRQLERYLGHLEELLYDTYLRKIMILVDLYFKKLEGNTDLPKKKMEYANQISQMRIVNNDITINQKIDEYEKIIKSIRKDETQIK